MLARCNRNQKQAGVPIHRLCWILVKSRCSFFRVGFKPALLLNWSNGICSGDGCSHESLSSKMFSDREKRFAVLQIPTG